MTVTQAAIAALLALLVYAIFAALGHAFIGLVAALIVLFASAYDLR